MDVGNDCTASDDDRKDRRSHVGRKYGKYRTVHTGRFVQGLSRAFLAACLIMGLFVVLILFLATADDVGGGDPLRRNLKLSRRTKEAIPLSSGGRYSWALPRVGLPSAVDDAIDDAIDERQDGGDGEYLCPPELLHLTQATNVRPDDNTVDMILSFTLPYSTCRNVRATVLYGRGESLRERATSTEVVDFTYDASLAIPELTEFQSDWIYHVTLPNLHAGLQLYRYRILIHSTPESRRNDERNLSPTSDMAVSQQGKETSVQDSFVRRPNSQPDPQHLLGQSDLYSLRTPPVTTIQPTSLALVGDLGQTEDSIRTMNRILQTTQLSSGSNNPVSAVVIVGDLSYADGKPRLWRKWMELMEPLLRSTPLFSVPGNHEIECDSTNYEVFKLYESYFRNPNRIAPAEREPIPEDYLNTMRNCLRPSAFLGHYDYGNAFWSVQHGMVHIVALNSYTNTSLGSPQYTWLENEFRTVDRSVTPWLLVIFHSPLHTSVLGHVGEINPQLMLESMEPLFVQYHVNLVVSGHDHAYLRTKSMIGTKVDESRKGPIYLTLGVGGKDHSDGYIHPDAPEEWVVKRDIVGHGFGRLQVSNATHAHFKWIQDKTTTTTTTTEGIQDSVWFRNQYFL